MQAVQAAQDPWFALITFESSAEHISLLYSRQDWAIDSASVCRSLHDCYTLFSSKYQHESVPHLSRDSCHAPMELGRLEVYKGPLPSRLEHDVFLGRHLPSTSVHNSVTMRVTRFFYILCAVALAAAESIPETEYDVIVVGGGPSGLSALSGVSRVRRTALLFDDQQYRNAPTRNMHDVIGNDGKQNSIGRIFPR